MQEATEVKSCQGRDGSAMSRLGGLFVRVLGHRRVSIAAALIAMAMAMPSIWAGLQGDDLWQRAAIICPPGLDVAFEKHGSVFLMADGKAERTRHLMSLGLMPWWCVENLCLVFWRPISAATHSLDYALWPDDPRLMHLQSIAWYGAWVLCVSLLYRRLIPTAWVAGLAAVLFAIDDAHSLGVGWLASRNTVISGLFGVLCLLCHDQWRRKGGLHWGLLGAAMLGLALLSKEAAIGACAYLLAYTLFLEPAGSRSRWLALAPYAVVVLGWQLAYRHLGFGVSGCDMYFDPADSPFYCLRLVAERAPILQMGQWGCVPADIVWILNPWEKQALWVLSLLLLSAIFMFLLPLLRADRLARFCLAGMTLATIPACLGVTGSRLLEHVGVGAIALLALWLQALLAQRNRWTARLLIATLLVINVAVSPVSFIMTQRTFGRALAVREDALTRAIAMPGLAGKTVLLLNPPHASYGSYMQIRSALAGLPLPAHVWTLTPGRFRAETVHVRRLDSHRLEVEMERGIAVQMERGHRTPLAVGDTVVLDGMTVTVSGIDAEGQPRTMVFAFSEPLESSSLVWLKTSGTMLVPWSPPGVGDSAVSLQP